MNLSHEQAGENDEFENPFLEKHFEQFLRKGKEHYFCPKRYHEYMDSLLSYPELYSKTIQELRSADLLDKALDLDTVQLSPHIKSRVCVKGSCYDCPRTDCCKYADFIRHATNAYKFDFQITNHNLLLTTRKMRKNYSSKSGLLPCNFCIVDEAHKLAETAVDVFGCEIPFDEVGEYLYSVKYNGGISPKDRVAYKLLLVKAEYYNKKLLSMFAHYKFKACEDICEVKIEVTPAMRDTIKKLITVLKQIGNWSVLEGATGGNTASNLTDRLSLSWSKSTGSATTSPPTQRLCAAPPPI